MSNELRIYLEPELTAQLTSDDLIELSFAAALILDDENEHPTDDAVQDILDGIIRKKYEVYAERWAALEAEILLQGFPEESVTGKYNAFWRKAKLSISRLYDRLYFKSPKEVVKYASRIGLV